MDLITPPSEWFETTTEANPPPPTRTTPPPQKPMPFSTNTFFFLSTLITTGIAGSIALFGLVSNIINLVVFYRQGPMSNSCNLVLSWLSLLDLYICAAAVAVGAINVIYCYFVDRFTSNWMMDFSTLIFARPMEFVFKANSLATTFLTFERAVSVVFPFKVNILFTPKRCLVVLLSSTVILFNFYLCELFQYTAHWSKGRMIFTKTEFFPEICIRIIQYGSIPLRILSLVTVLICNIVIMWKVKMSHKFRSATVANVGGKSATSKQGAESTLNKKDKTVHKLSKDIKLLRMIMAVSAIFLVCYSLNTPHVIVFHMVLEIGIDYNWSVERLVACSTWCLKLISSSFNTLIYYNMSSSFKKEFQKCWTEFRCKSKRK